MPARDRLQVFGGGAVGTTLRLALVTPLVAVADGGWPLATFVVNVAGAFLLGVLVVLAETRPGLRARLPLLATGLLGSLTTFSALVVGTVLLAEAGHPFAAGAYLGGSVVAGLTAAALGLRVPLGRARPGPAAATGTGA